MNQLNKLIEQLENTLDSARKMYHNSEQWYSEPEYNDTYEMRLNKCFDDLKAFASRPTCGVEQRKFLDEVEKDFEMPNTDDKTIQHKFGESLIDGYDFEDICDLQKVVKGE